MAASIGARGLATGRALRQNLVLICSPGHSLVRQPPHEVSEKSKGSCQLGVRYLVTARERDEEQRGGAERAEHERILLHVVAEQVDLARAEVLVFVNCKAHSREREE